MSDVAIRGARADDLAAICTLVEGRGQPDDVVDLRLIIDSVGLAGTAVATVDGVVAATATLLDEQVRVGSVTLPAGQVELVATDRSYEHRGLVRSLMEWCHERSQRRGHLLQVMIGIPYFYRQFGYSYSIPMHSWAEVTIAGDLPDGYSVRPASSDDVAAMAALSDAVQSKFDVAMPHQSDCWSWLVAREGSVQWVVEQHGTPVGAARLVMDDAVMVGEIATDDAAATRALLLAAATEAAKGARALYAADRPHIPGLHELLHNHARQDWYYVRVADAAALLDAIRPELAVRLLKGNPDANGDVLLSLWRTHVRFSVGADGVGPVVTGGPCQSPVTAGGSGLPPDAFPALLFGCGAAGLEDRFPDAVLGHQTELMTTLFPAQDSDVLTFYLPL